MIRVLRPGGRLVDRRAEPAQSVRPADACCRPLPLQSYGPVSIVSRRQLRKMLQRSGAEVVAETGILFMPGWLRMLDLTLHCWCRPLGWAGWRAVAACPGSIGMCRSSGDTAICWRQWESNVSGVPMTINDRGAPGW